MTDKPAVRIASYGAVHALPPTDADVRVDLTAHFSDPEVPCMRDLNGRDHEVVDAVLATPGIAEVVDSLAVLALACLAGPADRDVRIAVGCPRGRYRSVAVVDRVAQILTTEHGVPVHVAHRDVHRHAHGRES